MQRQVPGKPDECVVAGDEVGLTVNFDQYADFAVRVDVGLDRSLGRLVAGALGGLSLAART